MSVTILLFKKIFRVIEIRYDPFKQEIKKTLSFIGTERRGWNVNESNSSHILLDTMVKKWLFGRQFF